MMKKIKLLILGGGMYVCGRGTNTDGTIIPSLLSNNIEKKINFCQILGNSNIGVLRTRKKINKIVKENKNTIEFKYSKINKINQVLKKTKFNCAIVCLPDDLHYKYIKILLNNKINVITVKPFVTNSNEALELIKLAKDKKVISQVDFHKRNDEANLMLKSLIEDNYFGDLIYSTVEYSQPKIIPEKLFKNWAMNTNVFQYLGIHYVDLVSFLTNFRPISVYASGVKNYLIKRKFKNYDSIHAIIDWKSKNNSIFKSIMNINWIDPNNSNAFSDQRITIFGTEAKFKSDQTNRGISIYKDGGIQNPNPYFSGKYKLDNNTFYKGYGINVYKNFINDVYKKINGIEVNNEGRATFKSSLDSVLVSEALLKSLETDKKVIIEQPSKLKDYSKSLYAIKNLQKGSDINLKNFYLKSSYSGISIKQIKELKKKKITADIKKGELLNYSNIFDL